MGAIQESVRRFIAEYVGSVGELELLLLLYRDPRTQWSVEGISRELGVERSWATRRLEELCRRGFVAAEGSPVPSYAYRANAEVDAVIGAVARTYAERRVAVIELIFSRPHNSIRTFASAFRLRKEEEDG